MKHETLQLWQTKDPRRPRTEDGRVMEVPAGWEHLAPGDAALTRRVKAAGPSWTVRAKKGRRTFSQGVWAPAETIARLQAERAAEQADPKYTKRLEAGRARRAKEQEAYVEEFTAAVATFLAFAPRYTDLQARMARAIAEHATPVGSGTVARTKRIDVQRRAEAATIAWMRHQTTAYDDMSIPRVKGMRREVRRMLAERSRKLLARYRRGESIEGRCPLSHALEQVETTPSAEHEEAAALIEIMI
ncbi:MAG: DUF2293 domain-containing protein [Nannocystaceae bacterium]|nr:DUF2293 domain-containing protein [bacterium]